MIYKPDIGEMCADNVKRDGDRFVFGGDGAYGPEHGGQYARYSPGGTLSAAFEPGTFFGYEVAESLWVAIDVTALTKFSATVEFVFGDVRGRTLTGKMGVMPNLRTRLALPLSTAEGGQLFIGRTPGRLKTVAHGTPLHLDELCSFALRCPPSPDPTELIIHDFFITDEKPAFPLSPRVVVDSMGQRIYGDWPGKTHGEDELRAYLNAELDKPEAPLFPGRTRFGGCADLKLTDGTGYFSVAEKDGRAWLVDPDGYAFFSAGLDCVGMNDDANLDGIEEMATLPPKGDPGWSGDKHFGYTRRNYATVFGERAYDAWSTMTARRMNEWGFNTVACWSDENFARAKKIPYVTIMRGYPRTSEMVFRDFPDVFSDEFEAASARWARTLERYKGDAYLIGYFLSNEPMWAFVNGISVSALLLEDKRPLASKRALARFALDKYGSVAALNDAWGSDYTDGDDIVARSVRADALTETAAADMAVFDCELVRRFIGVPSKAARAVDPDHLNLGIRYAWISSPALAAGSEFVDVFSINCYAMDPTEAVNRAVSLSGKPVMIGEFHFGALDRGLEATGIRGVTSQRERGVAYRRYLDAAAAHPSCVGAHYFILLDQPYLGRFDGENYQIGLVDVCGRPYDEFVEGIRETHLGIYDVARGITLPSTVRALEIPAVFF